MIDKALLLFIIVELYQTVVAYTRDESVTRIVIVAGLIAISWKTISFRPGDFAGVTELVANAGAYAALLLALVVAYYIVQTTETGTVDTEPRADASTAGPSDGDPTTVPDSEGDGRLRSEE